MVKNRILQWPTNIPETRIVHELNKAGRAFARGKKHTCTFYRAYVVKAKVEKLILTVLI